MTTEGYIIFSLSMSLGNWQENCFLLDKLCFCEFPKIEHVENEDCLISFPLVNDCLMPRVRSSFLFISSRGFSPVTLCKTKAILISCFPDIFKSLPNYSSLFLISLYIVLSLFLDVHIFILVSFYVYFLLT